MAELTESQKYEIGIAIHKWQRQIEALIKNAKTGDLIGGEINIKATIGINGIVDIKVNGNGDK